MKAKKIFLAILSVMMAFCCAGLVACKDNNKPKPNPGGKDDVFDTSAYGNYYYLTTEDEYKLTVDASNFKMTRQDLKIESDKANYTGTYTYKDGVVSVTFKDNTTATATYDKTTGILTVKYDNSSLTFVKDVTYTVTFDSNGGSSVESQQVRNGQTATSPVPPVKDGYTFLKWYKDAALKNAYNFNNDPVTSDMTLYAKYGDKMTAEFTVTFRTGFEDLSVVEATTVDGKLSAADVPALTKEGYTFVGWWLSSYEDSAKLTAMYEEGYTFTQNETLYAVWNASGSDEMHVSVYGDKIKIYNPVTSGGAYDVEILNGKGVKVDGKDGLFSGTFDYDFSALDEGDYTVKVTYGGRTATAYYKNKALARVSSFRVEEGVFMFNEVANAEYYTVTVDCGNKDHEHENLKIKGNSYNFTSCEMQEGGIRFTVKAYADGYLTSTSEVYVYKKNLSEVTGLAYDSAKSELTWNAVANADNYVVTVNGESYVVDGTSYSLRYETGSVKVSVKAEAKGYISSTAALDVTISRLATPTNIKISNNVITWDAVEGATGYVVKMLGRENEVTGTSYTIPANTIGSTKITIVAKAANSANNSVASEEIAIEKNSTSMNPVYNNGKVAWNYLYNVDTYVVKVNDGEEFEVSGKNEADVVLTKEGKNVIYVKAKSDKSWQHVDVTAYKITYETNADGMEVVPEYKAVGDTLKLSEITNEGYDFGGWYLNKDGAKGNGEKYSDYKFTDAKNMTLYASWNPKTYTIYLKLNEADENPTEVYVKYREYFSLGVANEDDAAKMFKGWYASVGGLGIAYTDRSGNSNFIFNNTSDKVLYPGWYTVLVFSDAVSDSKNLQVKKGRDLELKENSIEEVTIPEVYNGRKVTEINSLAFENCTALKTINIPDSLESLAISNLENASSGTGSAFQKDTALESVNVYGEGTRKHKYFSEDGAVYVNEEDGGVSLLLVPAAKTGSFRVSENADYIPSRVMQNSLITELTIPSSVKEIGANAFDTSRGLKKVVFEEGEGSDLSLTIGDRAFKSCGNLETLVLPSHLTEFNPKMFYANSALMSIEVNGNGGRYSSIDGMLCEKGEAGESGLTLVYVPAGYAKNPVAVANKGNIEIPGEVKRIGDYAFAVLTVPAKAPADGNPETEKDYTYGGVSKIYSVKIPYGVTYIGKGAFKNCTYLKSVEFEEAQVSIGLKLDICEEAFAGCTALKNITIPSHTKKVEKYAFSGTTNLTQVTVNVMPGATLEKGAFQDKEDDSYYVTKVNIGKNTDIFDINGVFGGTKITAVDVDDENPYISSVDGVLFNHEGTTLIFYPAGKLGSYVIPEKVTEIASAVFSGKTNITEITIGKNVEIIGERAFKDCGLLTKVTFEEGGTADLRIEAEAFMGCMSLNEIVIPERTVALGAYAFANCTSFTSINIPKNVTGMLITESDKKVFNVFDGCTSLSEITVAADNANYYTDGNILYTKENDTPTELIFVPVRRAGIVNVPTTVNNVIDRAFYQNVGVTEVIFNKTDDTEFVLGEEVFSQARALTRVVLPTGLKAISERSFLGCAKLESITIPYTVGKLGELAFYGCTSLSNVTFTATPDGVEKAELVIADGAEYNGDTYGVFGECYSLGEIIFPERTTVIGSFAFGQKSSTKADTMLRQVTIPSTIKSIGDYAFGNCIGISKVNMPETSALADIGSAPAIGIGAFAGLENVTEIKLPESANKYTLGANSFAKTGIVSVFIPASVKDVASPDTYSSSKANYGAFNAMPNLQSIVFAENSGITEIKESSFRGNSLLNKVALPSGIEVIKTNAFRDSGKDSEKAMEFTFSAKADGTYALTTIESHSFNGVTNLREINFPDGLTTIGDSAFFNAGFRSLTIPYTVTTIGVSAFAGTYSNESSLEELTFNVGENGKSKLQLIKSKAFYGSRMTNVEFPETENDLVLGNISGTGNSAKFTGQLFSGNVNLRTAKLSTSVKDITDVFTGCPNMQSIEVAEGHTVYSSNPGEPILYNVSKTAIVYICGQLKGNVAGEEGYYRIADGITTISAKAFEEQLLLKKVFIPKTVMTIEAEAFKDSSNLKEVVIEHGNGVTSQLVSIGASAFENCVSLTTINLPANQTYKELLTKTFNNCTSLTTLVLPEGLETIQQLSLSNTGITELTIPSTVKTLVEYNNYPTQMSGLYNTLSYGVLYSSTGSGNFTAKLKKLTILCNPESIGTGAFAYCQNLTEVNLSEKLTSIGVGMFAGCKNLKTIKVVDESGAVVKGEENKAVLPDSLTEIGNFAFSGAGITEITIPENVEKLGENRMKYATSESPFYQVSDIAGSYESYTFYMNYPASLEKVTILSANAAIVNGLFQSCGALTTVVLNSAMTRIPDYMFRDTANLRTVQYIDTVTETVTGKINEVTLPSGVTEIGKDAFASSGFEKIVFGENVKTIEVGSQGVFYHTDNLKSVAILGKDTVIGGTLVAFCDSVKEIILNKDTETITDQLVSFSSAVDTVKLYDPKTKKLIGNDGEAWLPAGMTEIPKLLFSNANSLKTVVMNDAVTTFKMRTFCVCPSLTTIKTYKTDENGEFIKDENDNIVLSGNDNEVRLPSALTTVTDGLLYNTPVTTVIFTGNSLKSIVSKTFELNKSLATVKYVSGADEAGNEIIVGNEGEAWLPEGVESVGATILKDSPVRKVVLPSTLTQLGSGTALTTGTFYGNTALQEVVIKSSGITKVGAGAFAECANLEKVTLPSSFPVISAYMFYNCMSLEYILDPNKEGEPTAEDLTTAVIPEDVTTIGTYAFYNTSIGSAKLGSKLKTIGSNAFANCLAMTSFTVVGNANFRTTEDGLLLDGAGNFIAYPAGLDKDVVLPEGITTISDNAFEDSNIRSIKIPASVTTIGAEAFKNTTNLRKVTFAEGSQLIEIGDRAFQGSALREITLPASVEKLGTPAPESKGTTFYYKHTDLNKNGVFMDCDKLEKVTMLCKPTTMSQGTFAGCSRLTEVVLPEGMIELPEFTFYDCGNLVTVRTISDGVENGNVEEVTLPNSMRVIGSGSFASTGIKKITIPASLNTLGDLAFNYHKNTKSKALQSSDTNAKVYGVFYNCTSLETVEFLGNLITMYDPFLFNGCTALTKADLPDNIEYIEEGTYYYCSSLVNVKFPSSLKVIGFHAFQYSGIKELTIPDSVTDFVSYTTKKSGSAYIEQLASANATKMPFRYCTALETVVCNVKTLPMYMFADCPSLKTATINSATIGTYLFTNDSSLKNVTFGDSVTSLGNYPFKGCTSLTSVTLPEKITKIGTSYFEGCTSLKSVTFGGSITEIQASAFKNCSSLTEVALPETLKTIANNAFDGCSSLTSIELPSKLTSIGYSAFARTGLTEVTIPKGVTTLGTVGTTGYDIGGYYWYDTSTGNGAFAECDNLTKVVFEEGFKGEIGVNTFIGCHNLTEVVLSSTTKGICTGAFADTAISSITIPASVVAIGTHVFDNCDNLTAIEVDSNNAKFKSVNGVLYGKGVSMVNSGEDVLIAYPAGKTDAEFTVSVSDVLPGAFVGNDHLKKVTLPGNMAYYTFFYNATTAKKSSNMATSADARNGLFGNCSALTTVVYTGEIGFIPNYMFKNCVSLKTVGTVDNLTENKVILEDVTRIGTGAFNNTGIEDLTVRNGSAITFIGYTTTSYGNSTPNTDSNKIAGAFANNASLVKAVIDTPIAYLPAMMFYNTPNLTDITLPDSYTGIGAAAFMQSGIREYKAPESLLYVGQKLSTSTTSGGYTFAECANLSKVELNNGLIAIDLYAFYNCPNITEITIPDSVEHIGKMALAGTSITEFVLPASTYSYGGFAYNSLPKVDTVTVEKAESIMQKGIFYGMKSLKKVDFSKANTTLLYAYGAIAYSGVETVLLPSGSNSGYVPYFFLTGTNVRTIDFPEGMKTLKKYSFYKSGLTSVTVPGTVNTVEDGIFRESLSLETAVIEEGVKTISSEMFYGCTNLKKVVIPSTVTSIASNAFEGCDNLTEVVLSEDNGSFELINGVLFEKSAKTVVTVFNSAKGKDFTLGRLYSLSANSLNGYTFAKITLPVGYEDIGDYALAGVTADAVVLSSNTKSIGEYAFANAKVTSLAIPATVDYIDANAFDGWTADQTITFTITEAEATAKYGTDWLNGCNATIVYKQA